MKHTYQQFVMAGLMVQVPATKPVKVVKARKGRLTFDKDPEAYLQKIRERVAILHLCESDGQRYQQWLKDHSFLDQVLA